MVAAFRAAGLFKLFDCIAALSLPKFRGKHPLWRLSGHPGLGTPSSLV
jgi:hypothetical protein